MDVTFQLRRDSAANWATDNPVLAVGEPGLETDTNRVKMGDGMTTWTGLSWWPSGTGTVTSITVASANGFSGTVANGATTPQVTLGATASGILKGSSGALVAATAGTDYLAPAGNGSQLTGITVTQVGAASASGLTTEVSRAQAAEALLAPKASPTFTGTPLAPTPAAADNSTKVATTAYSDAAVLVEKNRAQAAEVLLAPKASPSLTGTPTAPTASAADNSTKVATTAYADAAVLVESTRATTAEGLALAKASNLSDVASPATALTNLGGLRKVADTGPAGYTMLNGTGTVLSWTAPADGQLHTAVVPFMVDISATLTGGELATTTTAFAGGRTYAGQAFAAGGILGLRCGSQGNSGGQELIVPPGGTLTLGQFTAITAGAAVVYAQIWAL